MVVVLLGNTMSEDADLDEYQTRSRRMNELVSQMPGFISFQSYTSEDGESVSVARFASEPDLDAWRRQPEHIETQRRARENSYESYWVQVCKTIRDYEFSRAGGYVQHPL
jgi:heme-degrading monooxygenase HmoA